MNVLFTNSDECLYSYYFICISGKGIEQGYNIVLHTITITVLSSIYIRTTTSIEIMKGIESAMRPLRVFNVPTKDIALINSDANIRFYFIQSRLIYIGYYYFFFNSIYYYLTPN